MVTQKEIDGLFNTISGAGLEPNTITMSQEVWERLAYNDATRKAFALGEYRGAKVSVVPKPNRKQRRAFAKRG